MGALLDHFRASGVALAALPGDRLQATGALTDAIRATIREHKAAILAELAANDAAEGATREQATELRELVGIVAADWPDDERAEAIAAALADPDAALVCFRALAAERGRATADRQEPAPADMRPCADCANFTPSGRCLAAWRGEPFGAGIATSRTWTPAEPERPQRCGAYSPGPNDPDKRTGRERWPYLFDGATHGNGR